MEVPIKVRPPVKRRAAIGAPGQTSDARMRWRGITLWMRPNNKATRTNARQGVAHVHHGLPGTEDRVQPAFQYGHHRARHQRHAWQEADGQDHAEGQQAGVDERVPAALAPMLRHAPDPVERVLQPGEHGRRADEQQHHAKRGVGQALRGLAHAGEQALHGARTLLPHQRLQLDLDLAARRLLAESEPAHRDPDEQQRRQRKHRVAGQCSAHARHVVVFPRIRDFHEQGLPAGHQADLHHLHVVALCAPMPRRTIATTD